MYLFYHGSESNGFEDLNSFLGRFSIGNLESGLSCSTVELTKSMEPQEITIQCSTGRLK